MTCSGFGYDANHNYKETNYESFNSTCFGFSILYEGCNPHTPGSGKSDAVNILSDGQQTYSMSIEQSNKLNTV